MYVYVFFADDIIKMSKNGNVVNKAKKQRIPVSDCTLV